MSNQTMPNLPERRRSIRSEDHDAIIEIKTKLDRLLQDVADIKTNTTQRVESLEGDTAQSKELLKQLAEAQADQETRLRKLEMFGYTALGIILFIQFLAMIYPLIHK